MTKHFQHVSGMHAPCAAGCDLLILIFLSRRKAKQSKAKIKRSQPAAAPPGGGAAWALYRAHVVLTDDLAQLTGDPPTPRDTTVSTDSACAP
jgi:hypothetical protein